jgi:hypothetical protein
MALPNLLNLSAVGICIDPENPGLFWLSEKRDFCLTDIYRTYVTVTNLFSVLQDPSDWIYPIHTKFDAKECANPDRLRASSGTVPGY